MLPGLVFHGSLNFMYKEQEMDMYEVVRNPGRNLGNVFTSLMYEASVNLQEDISFFVYFLELKYDPNELA